MKITKIVLTGGPGSGKTTMIEALKSNLKEKGYKVIVVNETARELAEEGIALGGSYDYVLHLQELVLKRQLHKERDIEDFAKNSCLKDVVILYDRGVLDNKAYLKLNDDFKYMLIKNNEKEIKICDKYNLVIDLKSAANLGYEFYRNDEIRGERLEDALNLDYKTTNAWALAPNLKIINPTVKMGEKEEKVIKLVNDYLNGEMEMTYNKEQIEDKSIDLNNILENGAVSVVFCTNYYIDSKKDNIKYIVSKRIYDESESLVLKKLREENGKTYLMECSSIGKEEFRKLRMENRVIKTEVVAEITFLNEEGKLITIQKDKDDLYIIYDKNDYKLDDEKDIKTKIKKLKVS